MVSTVEEMRRTGRAPAPPRWAVASAWAVPACILPSALWRLALVLRLFGDEAPAVGSSMAERLYVPGLSVVSVALGALTVGLVREWGEVVPSWVPGIAGRTVPVKAAVIPALAGATVVSAACAYALLNAHFNWVDHVRPLIGEDRRDGAQIRGAALELGVWAYAPLILWGPLLLAVTMSYAARRRGRGRPG